MFYPEKRGGIWKNRTMSCVGGDFQHMSIGRIGAKWDKGHIQHIAIVFSLCTNYPQLEWLFFRGGLSYSIVQVQ